MVAAAYCVFGLSMQMISGCGSGTLINAGSGRNCLDCFATVLRRKLLGTLLVPTAIEITPHIPVNFTKSFGVGGSVVLTVAGLFALGIIASRFSVGSLWNRKLLIVAAILAALAIIHVLVAGQPGCCVWPWFMGRERRRGSWLDPTSAHLLDPSD